MKKNYITPITGIDAMSVKQVLCASPIGLQFTNETPGSDWTAD